MDFSYEEIAKYVLDYEIDGNRVIVEFQNDAGEVFDSTAVVKRSKTITDQVAKKVGRMAKSQARRHATRMVRSALGGGMLGRIGSQVVRGQVNDTLSGASDSSHSEADIQDAIAKSFRRVSKNFGAKAANQRSSTRERRVSSTERRSSSRERNESRGEELDFQGQLKKHPISNLFEQDILSRILVSVAGSDGQISEDERNLIIEMLPKKIGSISDIASRGDISSVEAEEIDSGVKKSILLLAWSVALVDFDLDAKESRKLNEYASLFNFDHHEAKSICDMAKYETLSSVMDPYMAKSDLFDAANGIEIEEAEAERMLIKFKKSVSM